VKKILLFILLPSILFAQQSKTNADYDTYKKLLVKEDSLKNQIADLTTSLESVKNALKNDTNEYMANSKELVKLRNEYSKKIVPIVNDLNVENKIESSLKRDINNKKNAIKENNTRIDSIATIIDRCKKKGFEDVERLKADSAEMQFKIININQDIKANEENEAVKVKDEETEVKNLFVFSKPEVKQEKLQGQQTLQRCFWMFFCSKTNKGTSFF
jgi:chromosome segregation ATPase